MWIGYIKILKYGQPWSCSPIVLPVNFLIRMRYEPFPLSCLVTVVAVVVVLVLVVVAVVSSSSK